jgi:hypothetical protein
MVMLVRLKFHGLNSFRFQSVETNIKQKPPFFKNEAVFIELFKVNFRKINFTIDNPKSML